MKFIYGSLKNCPIPVIFVATIKGRRFTGELEKICSRLWPMANGQLLVGNFFSTNYNGKTFYCLIGADLEKGGWNGIIPLMRKWFLSSSLPKGQIYAIKFEMAFMTRRRDIDEIVELLESLTPRSEADIRSCRGFAIHLDQKLESAEEAERIVERQASLIRKIKKHLDCVYLTDLPENIRKELLGLWPGTELNRVKTFRFIEICQEFFGP